MAGRRLLYLEALILCGVFYIAYGQWLSWIILITVLILPWLSLLLSLRAISRFSACPGGPVDLQTGQGGELWLLGSCPFPMPPFRGQLKLKRCFTGESWYYQTPEDLPADHCGGITITAEAVRVCDYLGLFSFPVRCRQSLTLRIRPKPLAMDLSEDVRQQIIQGWTPKSGGGFAENHELRLYRPGDNLNQVHWKLSAKTGELILREPMEPQQGRILLTMNLQGAPDELDRKFGRLLWLGNHLLEQDLSFELQALAADGILTYCVETDDDLARTTDDLLCRRCACTGDLRQQSSAASWHYHIGGAADDT